MAASKGSMAGNNCVKYIIFILPSKIKHRTVSCTRLANVYTTKSNLFSNKTIPLIFVVQIKTATCHALNVMLPS